jgi:spore coat polysaccharide biosynthesis predicted glycosyltransferase SpsG
MNIRIIAEFSATSGFGNLIRSQELANEFSTHGVTELLVLSQFKETCESVLASNPRYKVKIFATVTNLLECISKLDHLILDCTSLLNEEITPRVKSKFPLSKVTALDYFGNNQDINLRISIFDQEKKAFTSKLLNHFVGLEYAVISRRIRSIKRTPRAPLILVKFSGNARELLETTEKTIRNATLGSNYEIRIVDNSTKDKINPNFEEQVEFLNRLAECSFYVGSGVTTLFESRVLETPSIFIGSNKLEREFGKAASSQYSLTSLDSTRADFRYDLESLTNRLTQSNNFDELESRVKVDYLGPKRIADLVFQL